MHLNRFLLVFFLLTSWNTLAQESEQREAVISVLERLETRYGVSFNFNPKILEDQFVEGFVPGDRLSEDLAQLSQKTKLRFEMLTGNFIAVTLASSGQICGYLKDKDTGAAIAFATVRGPTNSVITDDQGYFEMAATQGSVEIRYLGYRTINRDLQYFAQGRCGTVYMRPDPESLEQIVLTGYLVEGIDKLDNGGYQIDFDRFTILPGLIESDVLQTVQALPGIQSVTETVSNINIRGGTHDQNLIRWDGIKMYQSGHFFGLISAFNPQITETVELSKIGTPASRSDGVSGTIDMWSDPRVNSRLRGSIGVNLINLDGFLDVPLGDNSSIQLSGRKALSDWWKTPAYDAYFDRIAQNSEAISTLGGGVATDQQFDFYDTSVRWLYQPTDKDQIRLNLIYLNNELLFNENALVGLQETSKQSSLSQNSFGAGLSYKRDWNDDWQTLIDIYDTEYQLQAVNQNLLLGQRFFQENEVSETGVTAQVTHHFDDELSGSLGYQFIETGVTNLDEVDLPQFKVLISEVVRTHAPFTQWHYRPTNSTYIGAGLRYNYLDKFKTSRLEPRITVQQKLDEHWNVEASAEWKQQVTSQVINFQNDFLGVEKRRWQLSDNDSIPVIISRQLGAGVAYERDGWLIGLEGYHKQVEGITARSQGFQGPYEFVVAAGTYKVTGVDLLLRKQWQGLNTWLSYAWMDNTYEFPDLQDGQFPSNLDITHTVTFGTSYVYKNLKLAAGLNWHSGKPVTEPTTLTLDPDDQIVYGPVNEDQLDSYLRLDLSVLYELNLKDTELVAGLAIWNLLDAKNTLERYYRPGPEGQAQQFDQQALGLTPQAVVRWNF